MDEHLSGYLREMKHAIQAPISYDLVTNQGSIPVNDYLGAQVTISATGKKSCVHCGRAVKKLYQSGYCFPCVTSLAECDLCIVKPHECHFHAGTCRDESFAESHCMIPHYVYLAYSSSVKVGLTRKGRQMIRWVDQGASAAILLAEMPTRKAAGELEMEVAQFLPDKTDWRKMLQMTAIASDVNLQSVKNQVMQKISAERQRFLLIEEHTIHSFSYPRLDGYPVKLTSWSLDKLDKVSGTLTGVKGQYLLFEEGVLNVRKHAGYEVQISVS
jgi:hypothetical protein